MASAIIGGILSSDGATGITGDSLVLCNRTPEKAEKFAKYGAHIAKSAAEAVEKGDYILLAVKPQNIPDLISDIAEIDMTGKVFISILRRNIERYHLREARAEGSGSPCDAEYAVTDGARCERRRTK